MKTKMITLLCLLAFIGAAESRAAKRPNFVIIFIDDMGWRDWSGNGSDYHVTPNIDKIGEEGLVFDQGYVNAANCAPSRCALLSGQYPPRNDFYNVFTIHRGKKDLDRLSLADVKDGQLLVSERITFGEALQKAGYKTAMYGKWHVGGHKIPEEQMVMPDVQGFDDVLTHHPGLLKKMFKEDGDPKQIFAYTERAMDFAEKCTREDEPFLIYMAHHAIHSGPLSRPESLETYSRKKPGKVNWNPKYGAMMHDTDVGVGMLMKKIKDLGIDDNTIVFFLSDNGGYSPICTQAPLRGFKGCYYEGGIRVPFIVRWPGHIKPGKSQSPVMAIDLYPTMLELAGVKDIEKHVDGQPLDGTSIVPLLAGKTMPERSMFWHIPSYLGGNPNYDRARSPKYRQRPVSVIRKGDWKLLVHFEEWSLDGGREKMETNGAVELFNLIADPGETKNLISENPAKRDELLDELEASWKEIGATVPKAPNPKRKG